MSKAISRLTDLETRIDDAENWLRRPNFLFYAVSDVAS